MKVGLMELESASRNRIFEGGTLRPGAIVPPDRKGGAFSHQDLSSTRFRVFALRTLICRGGRRPCCRRGKKNRRMVLDEASSGTQRSRSKKQREASTVWWPNGKFSKESFEFRAGIVGTTVFAGCTGLSGPGKGSA